MRKTQIITLENANIEIVDGDRGKNYPKADEFSDKGYCVFLNTKNVLRNGFNFDKVMFISKQKDNFLRKGKIIRGDIVLTTRGTVGNVAVYDNQVPFEHIRINSGMLIFRPDLKYFYPKYLFRLFQSASIQNSFKEITSGSAQPQLPIRSLKYRNYSGRFLNQEDSTGKKGFPLMAAVIESRMFRPCFLAVER